MFTLGLDYLGKSVVVFSSWEKFPTEGIEQMMFYNGFNLLIDIILVAVVYVIAHGIGYRKGIR